MREGKRAEEGSDSSEIIYCKTQKHHKKYRYTLTNMTKYQTLNLQHQEEFRCAYSAKNIIHIQEVDPVHIRVNIHFPNQLC